MKDNNPAVFYKVDGSFHILVDNAPLGILVLEEGRITFCNPVAQKILEFTDEDLLGRNYLDLICEEDREYARNLLDGIKREKDKSIHPAWPFRLRILNKYRIVKWIEGRIARFFYQEKEALLITAISIDELVNSQNKAQEANLAKSEFLAHISHDIRTPLLGISGFCELLGQEMLNSRQRESVENIQYCTEQLLGLVNNLLDLSRIEARQIEINMKPFNLKHMIKQLLPGIQSGVKDKKIAFQFSISPEIPENILGDELKIRQVLNNLLENAAKFTNYGYVRIEVSRNSKKSFSDQSLFPLRISVYDTGQGVAGDKINKIFEPFVQANSLPNAEYKGVGLGLAISKQLVEMMGGNIWYEPNQEGGSVFSFALPVQEIPAGRIQESKAEYRVESPRGIPISSPTILLVEDVKINRKLIRYMLEDMGCQVITASNGQECIETLDSIYPDLILMDMQMPVMDGYKATTIIRQSRRWDKIPVIALTAYALSGDIDRCKQVGCDSYLSKPFTQIQLYQTLKQCLNLELKQQEPG